MAVTGRCLCGAIGYEIDAEPTVTGVCHCLNCQRQGGSAFSTIAGVPRRSLAIVRGAPKLYVDHDTASGSPVERYFCGDCGSPIYSALRSQPDMAFVKTGTLDDTSAFQPTFHVWCDSKQAWVDVDEGVPAFVKGRGSAPHA